MPSKNPPKKNLKKNPWYLCVTLVCGVDAATLLFKQTKDSHGFFSVLASMLQSFKCCVAVIIIVAVAATPVQIFLLLLARLPCILPAQPFRSLDHSILA